MSGAHWRGGVSPFCRSTVSAATNDGVRRIASIFYGTKPMGDSSMISMETWMADHCSQRRCHHPTFLRNEANRRFVNDFNDGIEFGTLGRTGAGHGEGGMNNPALPRTIRRACVSGFGFLRNEPNPGFDEEFKARKITQHYYGTNPIHESSAISMTAWRLCLKPFGVRRFGKSFQSH